MAEWTCESCVHYPPSSFGGKPCWMCNTNDPLLNRYEKREEPVITNADRIRAMSDAEMAEWICQETNNALNLLSFGNGKPSKSFFTWLEWLKEESE